MEKKENNKISNNLNLDNIDIENIYPCQLPFLNLSCYGCCGRDFKSEKEVKKDIKENTKEFNKIKQKSILKLLQFRDRLSENPDDLKPSGLCSNLVEFNKNCIACPLHPSIQKIVTKEKFIQPTKKDLRINHCDINYECETLIFWKTLTNEQKLKFIKWASKQNYTHYKYSVENIEGIAIRKFFEEEDIKIIYN